MAANDIMIRQRNAANAAFEERQIADPGADAVLKFNNTTNLPELTPVSTLFANAGAVTATSIATGTLSASGAALFADGTAGSPSMGASSMADGTGTGIYFRTASEFDISTNGVGRLSVNSTGIQLPASELIQWNSGAIGTAEDLTLRRPAAAHLCIGKADSATPLANTLTIGESSRAGTDTNVGGANGTIASGSGTGTGTASSLIFQTPTTTGSGSGAQTLATRLTLSSAEANFTGPVVASGNITTSGNLAAGTASKIEWTGRAELTSPADSKIKIANNGSTTGVTLDASTDGTLKLRNFADNADGTLTAGAGTFSGIVASSGGIKRVAANFDKTNTTLANITGLSVDVLAGQTYRFRAVLFVDTDAAGGQKFAIAGTATATSITYGATFADDTANAVSSSRSTALGGTVGVASSATATQTTIEGTIVVNAGGTLTVQFAQSSASGTSSVLAGSYFEVFGL